MSLFAIADTHLSLGVDKPMDIFGGWSNYVDRLKENWNSIVSQNDSVVIAGDVSWAMKLEETYNDFSFINSLNGNKILSKGNHDYWWSTKNKIDNYIIDNNFNTISILFNNSIVVDNYAVCGTRGWLLENDTAQDIKILNREIGRLKMSIEEGIKTGKEPIVFLHYPPIYCGNECKEIIDVLLEYGIKKCFYGHIHGRKNFGNAFEGMYKDINFKLISCDKLSFVPLLVR